MVVVAVVWGEHVVAVGDRLRIHAPPLAGDYRDRSRDDPARPFTASRCSSSATGHGSAARCAGRCCSGSRWSPRSCGQSRSGSTTAGTGSPIPLLPKQYLRTVPLVGNPLTFLRGFTDNSRDLQHPHPGTSAGNGAGPVVPRPARARRHGSQPRAGARRVAPRRSPPPSSRSREVAGEAAARAAAPFLVLAPAAIWWSSGDAFFAGVSAWAVTLVILATGKTGRESDRYALGGGSAVRRSPRCSPTGSSCSRHCPWSSRSRADGHDRSSSRRSGGGLVLLVFFAAGFSWIAGLAATRTQYWAGSPAAARTPTSSFGEPRGVRTRGRARRRRRARLPARSADLAARRRRHHRDRASPT